MHHPRPNCLAWMLSSYRQADRMEGVPSLGSNDHLRQAQSEQRAAESIDFWHKRKMFREKLVGIRRLACEAHFIVIVFECVLEGQAPFPLVVIGSHEYFA